MFLSADSLSKMEAHKKLRHQEMKIKILGTESSAVNSSKPLLKYCRQRKPSYPSVIRPEACRKLLHLAQRLRDTAQSRAKPDTDLKPHHLQGCQWCQWQEGTFLLIFLILCKAAFEFSPEQKVPCQVLKWLESFLGVVWILQAPMCRLSWRTSSLSTINIFYVFSSDRNI